MKPAAMRKFSTSHSSPLPPNEPGQPKRSVPGPTSPLHFIDLLFFSTLRKPMSLDPMIKAGIYLCISAIGSLIFDFVHAPPTYFSNKNNSFNQLFVKLGWGWTCGCLAAYLIVSSFVYTAGNMKLMRAHLLRLVAGSGCWYTFTGLINMIHDLTAHCHPPTLVLPNGQRPQLRSQCRREGGLWLGFDISGHCFLLVMCNLWILEELKSMLYWSKLADIIQPHELGNYRNSSSIPTPSTSSTGLRSLPEQDLDMMRSAYRRLSVLARCVFSFTACLSMLWDIMFISTVIYFHTMPSKLLGTLFGVSCWFVCYRIIFPLAKSGSLGGMAPGLPGDGPIDFVPRY